MNHKHIIFIGLLLISITSYSQSKNGIRKVNAYFSQRTPGNVPVDEKGISLFHGPDTITTIYVETKGVSIKWTGAWKNGKSYSIVAAPIKQSSFEVGTSKQTNQKIILKPAKGNQLWLLQLERNEPSTNAPVKGRTGEIILRGKSGKRTIIQRIPSQTELAVIPSV